MGLRKLGRISLFGWCSHWVGLILLDLQHLLIILKSWTRGTGLMGLTNIVAHELESYGVRTFSAKEMAFNILGLMHPLLFSITQVEPIWADLNGGMDCLPDLADITTRIHFRRAIACDNAADFTVINGVTAERLYQTVNVLPRANFRFAFPSLPWKPQVPCKI
jgi:fatty acid synthase subunit alpha